MARPRPRPSSEQIKILSYLQKEPRKKVCCSFCNLSIVLSSFSLFSFLLVFAMWKMLVCDFLALCGLFSNILLLYYILIDWIGQAINKRKFQLSNQKDRRIRNSCDIFLGYQLISFLEECKYHDKNTFRFLYISKYYLKKCLFVFRDFFILNSEMIRNFIRLNPYKINVKHQNFELIDSFNHTCQKFIMFIAFESTNNWPLFFPTALCQIIFWCLRYPSQQVLNAVYSFSKL